MMLRYMLRMPGVAETIGPAMRMIGRWPGPFAQTRAQISLACATYMPLPMYVRGVPVRLADVEVTLSARPTLALTGRAYYAGLQDFERVSVDLFSRLARGARTILDVGANVGVYALVAARISEARVVALEPQPMASMSVAKSAQLSGLNNIEVLPVALGASEGFLPLYTTVDDSLASLEAHRVPSSVAFVVPVVPLDVLSSRLSLSHVDLIKADVEGWELEVFRGGTKLFERDRPAVLFEVLDDAPIDGLRAFFQEQKYKLFAPLREGLILPTKMGPGEPRGDERNVLALPEERADELLAKCL